MLTNRLFIVIRCELFEIDSDSVFILAGGIASTAIIIGYLEFDHVREFTEHHDVLDPMIVEHLTADLTAISCQQTIQFIAHRLCRLVADVNVSDGDD